MSAVLRTASAAKNRIARENFSCRTQMIRKFLSFHLRANDSTKNIMEHKPAKFI